MGGDVSGDDGRENRVLEREFWRGLAEGSACWTLLAWLCEREAFEGALVRPTVAISEKKSLLISPGD